jgi:cytochrome c biogenesis protein CcdA/thiol-disulfide isomerase/thioredoxin
LLPIVLSTSLGGGKAKSLGITLGIVISFAVYNLSISYLVRLFGFDPNILRYLAIAILFILGLMMVVPVLSRFFEGMVSRLAGSMGTGNAKRNGFGGGLVTGLSLGIVWTPCAGPILTAIATLSATATVNFGIILVTAAYLIGVAIPLFAFSYGGQKFVGETRFLSKYTGRVQQVFGVILLLTTFAIATNYDKVIQAKLLDYFPSYSNFLTSFETNDKVQTELQNLKTSSGNGQKDDSLQLIQDTTQSELFNVTPVAAPDFVGITKWLNPEEQVSISDLKGKVVLVDFWTYTCINCIRTLPFVTSWYDKYKDKGFVVIGVHTPEFEFEKNTENVLDAIKRFSIHYPVAQDNDYATWNMYDNHYWPAEYLIDATGKVRRAHFGEGEYDTTEKAIQVLLKEAGEKNISSSTVSMPDQTPKSNLSPETYLGSSRMEFYYPTTSLPVSPMQKFTLAANPPDDRFSFGGNWMIGSEYTTAGDDAALAYNFSASKVFLVMRPPNENESGKVTVLLDGKKVSANLAGADVKDGVVTVDKDRLYDLIDFSSSKDLSENRHTLTLEFSNGVQVFAFTFG